MTIWIWITFTIILIYEMLISQESIWCRNKKVLLIPLASCVIIHPFILEHSRIVIVDQIQNHQYTTWALFALMIWVMFSSWLFFVKKGGRNWILYPWLSWGLGSYWWLLNALHFSHLSFGITTTLAGISLSLLSWSVRALTFRSQSKKFEMKQSWSLIIAKATLTFLLGMLLYKGLTTKEAPLSEIKLPLGEREVLVLFIPIIIGYVQKKIKGENANI